MAHISFFKTWQTISELQLITRPKTSRFEKLWQFSSFMVSKGFKIIEVGGEDKFDDGDMPKAEYDNVHVILRACKSGKPEIQGNRITVEGKSYTTT